MVVVRGELSNRFPPVHEPVTRREPVADERVPHFCDGRDFAIVEHHEAHHETSAATTTSGRPGEVLAGQKGSHRGYMGARRGSRATVSPATATGGAGERCGDIGEFMPPSSAFSRLTYRGSVIHHRRHR
ncbi:hypothetical protein DVZ84_06120 [Streptomyces parvulus]|uniref:Uncharacterized protein n=1 Tax=Streptomyces parvulus TaxID=146923 RepID=A0A369VA81_9ACTN|nr:hypothetical protein DVZ84_06120 [Streptomyces parvulus]